MTGASVCSHATPAPKAATVLNFWCIRQRHPRNIKAYITRAVPSTQSDWMPKRIAATENRPWECENKMYNAVNKLIKTLVVKYEVSASGARECRFPFAVLLVE